MDLHLAIKANSLDAATYDALVTILVNSELVGNMSVSDDCIFFDMKEE